MVKSIKQDPKTDFIKFLGTAGARFVMIKQLRASGGLWVSSAGINVLIDPGPGCIVRCNASKPKLDPSKLDGIILTHRHLDHSGDINVMIEAMTEGGFKKKGAVFCPADALGDDSVILKYAQAFPDKIEIIKPRQKYSIGDFSFQASLPLMHRVETYGLKFKINQTSVALLTDTRYFPGVASFYKADILIICVVLFNPRPEIDHLCLLDVEKLLAQIKPKKTILTHFGMSMLKAKPKLQAEILSQKLSLDIVAAYDGMSLGF